MADVESTALNDSQAVAQPTQLLPDAVFLPIARAISSLSFVIASMGLATNTLNIFVFYRIGLSTTANICFFSLSMADLLSVAFIFVRAVFNLPMDQRGLIITLKEVTFMLAPLVYSSYAVGSWITALINMERSCSVVFPLKVKQIFTRRFVWCLIGTMVVYQIATSTPRHFSFNLISITFPATNETRLGVDRANMDTDLSLLAIYMSFTIPTLICFFLVTLGTIFLIINFRRSIRQREKMTGKASSETSTKDARVVKSVILICLLYIGGFTITIVEFFLTLLIADFVGWHPYYGNVSNMFVDMGFFTQTLSCSVNIFVYLRMNTKYRETIKGLCS